MLCTGGCGVANGALALALDRFFRHLTSTTMATISNARPPKALADTPTISGMFGPGFEVRLSAAFDCEGVGVALVVVARVDCGEVSTELGTMSVGRSVLVDAGGWVVVEVGESEVDVVDSWVVVLVGVEVGVAEMEEEAEDETDVIEVVGDAVTLRVPLEVAPPKVEPGIERSNGGLYSKVLVESSMILKPYLSPCGIVPLSCSEFGMFHVKVPSLLMDAKRQISRRSFNINVDSDTHPQSVQGRRGY